MYKVTETYTDYLGSERTEDFYFNLTKTELLKMELSYDGGFIEMLKTLIEKKNIKAMINVFDTIINTSYGERTPDGRGFKKTVDILENFKATEAYSNIFFKFATDSKFAAEFVNGIIPREFAEEISKMTDEEKEKLISTSMK